MRSYQDISYDATSAAAREEITTIFKESTPKNYYLIILTLGFTILFSSFNAVQSHLPLILGKSGYWSLFVFYLVFGLLYIFIPLSNHLMGIKLSFIIGGILTSFIVLGAALGYRWLLIGTAFLSGLGATHLWSSQGNFLLRLAKPKFNRIFFSCFQTSYIWGNILMGIFVHVNFGPRNGFFVLFGIGFIGICMLLFLRRMSDEPGEPRNAEDILEISKGSIIHLFEKRMLLLMPLFIFNGISIAIYTTKVPTVIGLKNAGWSMSIFGIGEFLGWLLIGQLGNWVGAEATTILSHFVHAMAVGALFFLHHVQPYLFFVCTFLNGFADAGLTSQIYNTMDTIFKTNLELAFTGYRFIQSLSIAICMICALFFSLFVNQIILFVGIVISIIGFLTLDVFVHRVRRLGPAYIRHPLTSGE